MEASAASYDAGYEGEARRLAVALRLLLHETNRSRSLLGQLGVQGAIAFADTAVHFPPTAVQTSPALLMLEMGRTHEGARGRYVGPLDKGFGGRNNPPIPFRAWWEAAVLDTASGPTSHDGNSSLRPPTKPAARTLIPS